MSTARGDRSLLAYAGEVREGVPNAYLLGSRLYDAAGRRFFSPDGSSPFEAGGLNRYAYCGGDPITRIDPSGEAWWDWLLAGVGMALAVAGAVASGGALSGAVGAAGGMMAALSTSSGATAAAAALLDAVSVAAEIGAVATMASGDAKGQAIFGWIGLGTGVASLAAGGVALRMAKNVNRVRKGAIWDDVFADSVPPTRSGVARGDLLPAKVTGRVILGRKDLPPGVRIREYRRGYSKAPSWDWIADEKRFPGALHYAADAPVKGSDMPWLVKEVTRAHPGHDFTFLVGAHGRPDGQNWLKSGRRKLAPDHSAMSIDILSRAGGVAEWIDEGIKVRLIDLADLTPEAAWVLYGEPGIFIHYPCYGLVDELLLRKFNQKPRPVFVKWPHW